MATLTATYAKGKTLFDAQSWRLRDDIADYKVGGTYSHRPESWSATEADEWLSVLEYITTSLKTAIAVPVRNVTGSTLDPGVPLYISGYNAAEDRVTVAKADATDPSKQPSLVLDASLSTASNGVAYRFIKVINLDTSAATAVGDKVFLHASTPGALTFTTAPTTVDAIEIGVVRVKDAAIGEVYFYPGLALLRKFGPQRFQQSSINGQTAKTTPVDADELMINDVAGAAIKKCTRRQFLTEANQTDLTLLDAVPRWYKFTVPYTSFAAASTTNNIELLSLPATGVIHAVKTKHSAAFGGGGITAYTVSVGITGTLAKYSAAFNVFQAVSGTAFQIASTVGSESHTAAISIKAAATSTTANLDQATTGSVDIWVLLSKAPS